MDALEFVIKYPQYLQEIRSVIRPELIPQLDELEKTDPHDLVRPDSYFPDDNSARGYVWSIFVNWAEKFRTNGIRM